MPQINEETIRKACNDLADLLVRKNHDYGNSVQEQFDEYGETSLLIRLEDKMRRLKNLVKSPARIKEEKKAETFIDIAGYSVLGTILLNETAYDMNYQPPFLDTTSGKSSKF